MMSGDLLCVLGQGGDCVARVPAACLCRQMPETLYVVSATGFTGRLVSVPHRVLKNPGAKYQNIIAAKQRASRPRQRAPVVTKCHE